MLSLTKTDKPLCVVTEGKNKGTIIYYNDKPSTTKSPLQKKLEGEMEINSGKFFPIPTIGTRQCVLISGPSGVGKSWWISEYTRLYHQVFPRSDVYLFSNVGSDKQLDKYVTERYAINDHILDDPFEVKDFKDSLVIFDDVDTVADKQVDKALTCLRDQILHTGRHENVYFLNTVHLGLGGWSTRTLLNESTAFVLYPRGGNKHVMHTMLKTYAGLSNEQIEQILKIDSRWVYVNKSYPLYVVSEKKIYLL